MPRPKGSRNRTRFNNLSPDEKITALTEEINALQEQLKEKKAELKKVRAEKESVLVQQAVTAALESGKSVEEILTLLGGEKATESISEPAEDSPTEEPSDASTDI